IGQGVSDTVSLSGAASAVGNSNGITVISNGRLPATMSSRSPGADRPWAGTQTALDARRGLARLAAVAGGTERAVEDAVGSCSAGGSLTTIGNSLLDGAGLPPEV